jgi:hypothetical protein
VEWRPVKPLRRISSLPRPTTLRFNKPQVELLQRQPVEQREGNLQQRGDGYNGEHFTHKLNQTSVCIGTSLQFLFYSYFMVHTKPAPGLLSLRRYTYVNKPKNDNKKQQRNICLIGNTVCHIPIKSHTERIDSSTAYFMFLPHQS